MASIDALIEEELRKIVASGEDAATAKDDATIIEEASRRARSRAGLMTANAPSADAQEHWGGVLAAIREEGEGEPRDEPSATEEAVRAQLIP
jgi:hypothetical protein